MITAEQTVASIVLEYSECAAIFQRNRIDFCCQGDLTIAQACEKKGLDVDILLSQLNRAVEERRGEKREDHRTKSTEELIDYIVKTHHHYLREAMPFVQRLATKVSRVHGGSNPKLHELHEVVYDLGEALMPHLDSEEKVLFPSLLSATPDKDLNSRELGAMHEEHLEVGELLEKVREATDNFNFPNWACNSYRTLFAELEQLEGDVLQHVHLETHVLKPRFEA